jgi:hypothetical protein
MCSGFPHCSQESCSLPIIGGLLGAYIAYASRTLSHRVPVQNKARRDESRQARAWTSRNSKARWQPPVATRA